MATSRARLILVKRRHANRKRGCRFVARDETARTRRVRKAGLAADDVIDGPVDDAAMRESGE